MSTWLFTEPYRLLLLLLIPLWAVLYYYYGRNKYAYLLISHLPAGGYSKSKLYNPKNVFFALRILAVVCIILALASPASLKSEKLLVPGPDIDIVLALDVSGSMLIEDLKPNRLEALKEVIANFTAARSHDRFGLVLYAGESVVWSPLTHDSRYLLNRINGIDHKELADGTAIGLGLASAVNVLRSSKARNKVVILLTDGENNTGFIHPLTASLIAQKHKIKVYTIGMGTTGKAPMPITGFDGSKTYQYIDVKLDEPLLRRMAEQTGGRYFRATNRWALNKIYAQINRLETTKKEARYQNILLPQYRLFAGLALACVFVEILLSITLFRTFT